MPTLQTSKGRSVMDIAMEMKNVGILKYLVNERGVSVHEVKDLALVLGALESMIKAFPEDVGEEENESDKSDSKKKSPAKATDKNKRNKSASPKPYNMQQPYSVVPHSSKQKTLLPRDFQPAKNTGLYGNVGRYDSDDEKNNVHGAADSDDDCSVCTTREEMVRDL